MSKCNSTPAGENRASEKSSGQSWNDPRTLGFLLALVTLLLYWPVTNHEFVDYDDGQYVVGNVHVQAGLTWAGVKWAFATGEASNWHPLTWLSHMADVSLFEQRAGGHHFTSIAIHSLNALLLFLLLRRLTGAVWRSACVAALFALHPLRVESVAWVSERKDVLSGLFFLLTVGAYARYAEGQRGKGAEGKIVRGPSMLPFPSARFPLFYCLALLFFALGLMSKPMLVTLPFVLLLLDWWPLRRVSGVRLQVSEGVESVAGEGVRPTDLTRCNRLLALVLEKLPFFALSAASCVVTFLVQKEGGAVSMALPLSARLANAVVSCARYLRKTFWPDDLSVLYPHPGQWPAGVVGGAVVLLVILTVMAVVLGKRTPYVTVGWLWFLGMLVPVIGLVQVGIQSMADRYTYLPSVGVFLALVWSAGTAAQRWPGLRPVLGALAIFGLGVCMLLTRVQLRVWANTETLFRHAIAVTQNNYLAHNNLGFYLAKRDREAEAMECYLASLRLRPDYPDARNNLGHALAKQRRFAEAIEHYRIALRASPNHPEIRNNLGNALTEVGQVDAAIAEFEFVLQRHPDHADAHNNLGIALAMKGRLREAMEHFHQSLRLKPDNAGAHGNLGNAFAVQRNFPEATRHYHEALRLAPADAQTRNNLGNVLAEQGRLREAITNYRVALELNADNSQTHYNLAVTLARVGHVEEAKQHLHKALELQSDYPDATRLLNRLYGPADGATKP